ncbi:MAG: lipase family protein, partial [Myxococcota bacterium]|nr:lipase family protein [Myxococcota bacterium]
MMLIFWLACQNAQKNDDSAVATEATPAIPDFPLSQCGLREYNLLPTDTMGTIVSSERRDEFSFSKEALQALYNSFDFPLPQPETGVETHFIQYTTQDKGEEVLATGLIVIPTDIEEEMLTVLWEHFTLGLNDTCAPTAIGIAGAAHPVLFASLGNVVVAPDYIGMSGWRGESDTLHPYIVAEPTAIASLDSLRALHHFVEDEAPDIRIRKDHMVIWGASEGGFASLFTDRYLPHYAPEFESKATVAAIPPTDVLWLAKYGTEHLGETTLGILGSIT